MLKARKMHNIDVKITTQGDRMSKLLYTMLGYYISGTHLNNAREVVVSASNS